MTTLVPESSVPDSASRPTVAHLRAGGVSLVVAGDGRRLPSIVHWGADLGPLEAAALDDLVATGATARANNDLDAPQPTSVLPEQSGGWSGVPGLAGHRGGRGWSTRFALTGLDVREAEVGGHVRVDAVDEDAGLALWIEIDLTATGLVRHRAAVRNTGTGAYDVGHLAPVFPVPAVATEIFDLAGRWAKERVPQRSSFVVGTHTRENRRGRTGPDAPLVLAVGTAGFGTRSGEVWAQHVAFSGNHRGLAEKQYTGAAGLSGGELLLPGEVRLAPGEEYTTPWVYLAHSTEGLDGVAERFHRHVRSRAGHPRGPRPVIMNTWEAVYFDHDLARLTELARAGAAMGVERYVLDDGWFRHRRDDSAGLGDWYVDEDVWPQGLAPLIDVVTGLGMQFGLWVEPEMVNPDSDLARAHPEWILRPAEDRLPLPSRQQQVLDLGNPDAAAHLLERLDALLTENDISYLKWDHNRDLLEAGAGPGRPAGVHAQTLALYRLLDELRSRHPGVEIESCSSGGLRIDLEIVEHTDRVWGSDCIDPLERQQIQRWTTQLLPPELIGSHVGASPSHTTHRSSDLSFRAATALFCSFGVEADVTRMDPAERDELARWVSLYKEVRGLLHSGTVVRGEQVDDSWALHGVVAQDAADALFALVQLATPDESVPARLRLPGLDPDSTYEVTAQAPGDTPAVRAETALPWLTPRADGAPAGVRLTGRALAVAGVAAPALQPQQVLLLRTRKV